MMLKIAHMRENRKNNKGFSLVELIIVMAIMVALVAVLAPQYIRYLQRSRDAVVVNAAEDILTAIKTDIIDPEGKIVLNDSSTDVTVNAQNKNGKIVVGTGALQVKSGETATIASYIESLAGLSSKEVKSSKLVTIHIEKASDGTFTFESATSDMT